MSRIVFMGTPEFAVPSLRALAADHGVAGVVTQPDRRAGRGRKLSAAPTKTAAHELGLPVIMPADLRDDVALSQIADWKPDLIVVAAYGHILRPGLLELPASGCINVHASLLPRHRGAAPVAAAILAGDARTGVTIMKMDAGLDTGPVLAQREIAIDAGHTTGALTAELAAMGFAARAAHPCIGRGRADLVVAGCAILEAICRRWPVGSLRVADRGIREGLLLRMMDHDGFGPSMRAGDGGTLAPPSGWRR